MSDKDWRKLIDDLDISNPEVLMALGEVVGGSFENSAKVLELQSENERIKSERSELRKALDLSDDECQQVKEENERLKSEIARKVKIIAMQSETEDALERENERLRSELDACSEACKMLYADKQKLKDQYESTPEPRSNQQIVSDAKDLARGLYALHGYKDRDDINFHDSTHPQEQLMWGMACLAYEHIQGTDVDCVLDELTAEDIE